MKHIRIYKKMLVISLFYLFINSTFPIIQADDDGINEGEYYFGYGDSWMTPNDLDHSQCFVSLMQDIYDSNPAHDDDHNTDGGSKMSSWAVENFSSHFNASNDYFVMLFGYNDVGGGDGCGGDVGLNGLVTASNMMAMYNWSIENGTKPIICVQALMGNDTCISDPDYKEYDDQYARIMGIKNKYINCSISFVPFYDAIDTIPWDGRLEYWNTIYYQVGDSVHPNLSGQENLSYMLWYFIQGYDYNTTYYAGNDSLKVDVDYNETIYINNTNYGWNTGSLFVHCIGNNTNISHAIKTAFNGSQMIHFAGKKGESYLLSDAWDSDFENITFVKLQDAYNPVVDTGGSQQFTNGAVLKNPFTCEPVLYDGKYWMVWEAGTLGNTHFNIGFSTDMQNWTLDGAKSPLPIDAGGEDWNNSDQYFGDFIWMGDEGADHELWLFVCGAGTGDDDIGLYYSDDLITWVPEDNNPIISFSGYDLEDFRLMKAGINNWIAVYEDNGDGDTNKICHCDCNSTFPNATWTNHGELMAKAGVDTNYNRIANPCITRRDHLFYVIYEGVSHNGDGDNDALYVTSSTFYDYNGWDNHSVAFGPTQPWEGDSVIPNQACVYGNDIYCFYAEDKKIGLAMEFGQDTHNVIVMFSINGLLNNGVTQDAYRYFQWEKNSSASKYSIRVSNTIAMDDIFLQLDNITVSNGWCTNNFLNLSVSATPYGYNYWETDHYCYFYLPYCYNVSGYGWDYYQVRYGY